MSNKKEKTNISRKIIKYIIWRYKRLQRGVNNRNIRTKTMFLYAFCVLIPVLVTNIFIIVITFNAFNNDKRRNIHNIVESIARDVSSSFEEAVYATVDFYANNYIYKFLDTKYKDNSEYLREYKKIFDHYMFYASSKRLISDLRLYSSNMTMINGGRFYRIDSIESEDWYQEFIKKNANLFIYSYYENKGNMSNYNRVISVIRKLNFIELSNVEKIVKLDLNYNKIYEAIVNNAFGTTIYVCHNNKIIFSNEEGSHAFKEEFRSVSEVDMKKVQLHKSFATYGYNFDIYLKDYESNYVSMLKDNLWIILILFLANALIPALILFLFSNSIIKRILLLGRYMEMIKGEEFILIPENEDKDEIGDLLKNYNLVVTRMKNLIENEYKSKLEQQELHLARQQAELLALYSQINPHFMFNVLESIRMRCLIKDEKETSQMIESLARLMRKSAEWGSDLITIKQEIEFVEDYLNLQKYRFGSDFNYKFLVNQSYSDYIIPSLVLVTFVENACVHGLDREGHSGMIFISINEEDSYLCIEIEDTGIGMEKEQVKRMEKILNEAKIDELIKATSLGMLNACIRLKKYCGYDTKIILESERNIGTCISIQIPIENLKKNV